PLPSVRVHPASACTEPRSLSRCRPSQNAGGVKQPRAWSTLDIERRPTTLPDSSRLQAGSDPAEGFAQVGTDRTHNGDGGDCDERSNKPIFDCGNPRLVLDQLGKKYAHWVLLAVQARAGCRQQFDKALKRK